LYKKCIIWYKRISEITIASNNESTISVGVEDPDIFFSASYLLCLDVKIGTFTSQKCSYRDL